MTLNHAALLHDVAREIIASGYAVRPHIRRATLIEELELDARINCRPHSAGNVALIDDVTRRYPVSRVNARKLVRQARKMREEEASCKR